MKGRTAIYECMPVTQEIRDLIIRSAQTAEIREVAISQGLKTLRQSSLLRALDGITSLEEALRVTLA